MKYLVLIAAIS
jgi:hypothetical protein